MNETKSSKLIGSTLSFRSPFFWVGMLWGVVALALSVKFGSNRLASTQWLVGVWALCMFDLVALAKTLMAAILLMTPDPESVDNSSAAYVVQAIVWGSAKFLCLALFGILLWSAREAPHAALLLGLATLIVVPLLGGFCWSQKELNYA